MSRKFPFDTIGKAIGAVAGLALGASLSACNAENISFGGKQGVPLSELDMSGEAPTSLALAGPDTVRLTEGDRLVIEVEGSQEMKDAMRFHLEGKTLAIMRSKDAPSDERATVMVTMPAPTSLVIAGSGTVHAAKLADKADVTIAGSGSAETKDIAISALDVNIVGSGTYRASGTAGALDLNIAGSGDAALGELKVEKADISIAGSGNGAFRSDGTVDASIMGSGSVKVKGRARCEVSSMGSGKLICEEA
ncbi:head GIN domain-containing protein [Croceicoccus sediminis]|uniref:head GIN domain-containing protein n=1 Tax=Croceicoccus sediminis TaxID=2571150 RepID=UPI0011823C5C|nr:head GIN domain-containing protein [Croceicoccus sediminis]